VQTFTKAVLDDSKIQLSLPCSKTHLW